MMILPFDTETTGLPEYKMPSQDPCQPHLVQLGVILVDDQTMEQKAQVDVIIRPDGWVIPADMVHGISHEQAMDVGIPEIEALDMFLAIYQQAVLRVAHNTAFDNRIIRIALKRYRPDLIADEEWKDKGRYYCTMIEYCKIFGGKWPKLAEAYLKLTGRELAGAHSAMPDTLACMEIYFQLMALKKAA